MIRPDVRKIHNWNHEEVCEEQLDAGKGRERRSSHRTEVEADVGRGGGVDQLTGLRIN